MGSLNNPKHYSLTPYGNRFVRALGHRLVEGIEPACILAQGDSTGNGTNEWFYTAMQWLATKYPAYTVAHRLWNHTNQAYDASTVIQTGANGDAYAVLPNTANKNISTPDKDSLDIVGDIEIIVKVALDNWTAAGDHNLLDKIGITAGNYGYALALATTGRPYLWWSNDGTTQLTKAATATPALVNGQPKWFKATLDVDNGDGGNTVEFYTSDDGVTWAKLGDSVVTAGTTSIHASTNPISLGYRGIGSDRWAGKYYKAILKNGIGGKVVASPDLGMAFPSLATTFTDAEGNVWTRSDTVTVGNGSPCILILNAHTGSQAVAYSADEARFALQAPIEPQLAFINYSHNEVAKVIYQSEYEGLATQLLTAYPNVGVVCVTQNPQKSPELNIIPHAIRNRQIAALAARNNYGLVDTFRAFMDTGDYASYVSADGCHPNQTGFDLWRDKVIEFMQPVIL